MQSVLQNVAELIVLAMIVALLPYFGKLLKRAAKWYIKKRVSHCVKKAERIFIGTKLGAQKKAYVLSKTRKYNAQLQRMDDTIDHVIENAVAVLNGRNAIAKSELESNLTTLIDESKDAVSTEIQSKLSGSKKTNDASDSKDSGQS